MSKVETSMPKAVLEAIIALLKNKPGNLSDLDGKLGISRNWLSGFTAHAGEAIRRRVELEERKAAAERLHK